MKTGRKLLFAALLGALIVGGCDCEEKGRLVAKDDPDGSGGGSGAGGSGGGWVTPTPCETMCSHVEGHCRLQVPGLDEDCPVQCEETLSPDEVDCLSQIACTMEEVDACLGRGDACEAICELVYDQCGQEIVYGKGAAIEREDCEAICPLLDKEYRSCLAEAKTCPEAAACHPAPTACLEMCERVYEFCGESIDQPGRSYPDRAACEQACEEKKFSDEEVACLSTTPCTQLESCFAPSADACEEMCERVYDFCGETIDQPGRSYPSRAACDAACADAKFTTDEVDCLRQAPCTQLEGCFPIAPTACELMCEKVYDECNYAFPVGAKKEDKVDKARCISDCNRGDFSAGEMSCVEQESCEHLATCFDDVSRSCASACYWAYNHCDVELGITFGCFGGDCPAQCWMPPYGTGGHEVWFEGEGACFAYCEFGYQYNGPCNPRTVPAWSSQRKSCYRDVSQVYDYHQCKPAVFGPMDICDAYDPLPQ